MKLLGESIWKTLQDLGTGSGFLDGSPKAQENKSKNEQMVASNQKAYAQQRKQSTE
jgi:hypothetical protein